MDSFLRVLFLFGMFRIISTGIEMGISDEKYSDHQQLHLDFKGSGSKA
jgi:hypothetical protein